MTMNAPSPQQHLPIPFWNTFFGHCGTLPGLRGPAWTIMDPQMDPKMDPARQILEDPY